MAIRAHHFEGQYKPGAVDAFDFLGRLHFGVVLGVTVSVFRCFGVSVVSVVGFFRFDLFDDFVVRLIDGRGWGWSLSTHSHAV